MEDNSRHSAEEKKVRFRRGIVAGSRKDNAIWTVTVTGVSFLLTIVMTVIASDTLKKAELTHAFLVVLIIIFISIVFDVIGTAVTAGDEKPFHAMASRKFYAAKLSIKLIRNANKVSSLCNDVIGDVCGIISGVAAAYLIFRIIGDREGVMLSELVITGFITALTVGGKALGKTLALRNSNYIIYKVSVIINFILDRFSFGRRKRKTAK